MSRSINFDKITSNALEKPSAIAQVDEVMSQEDFSVGLNRVYSFDLVNNFFGTNRLRNYSHVMTNALSSLVVICDVDRSRFFFFFHISAKESRVARRNRRDLTQDHVATITERLDVRERCWQDRFFFSAKHRSRKPDDAVFLLHL